jgi:hypothetical protein
MEGSGDVEERSAERMLAGSSTRRAGTVVPQGPTRFIGSVRVVVVKSKAARADDNQNGQLP